MDKQQALNNFFEVTLQGLLSGEKVLEVALGKLAEKASRKELKTALKDHQRETRGQVERLEKIFCSLSLPETRNRIEEAEGLLEKGCEAIKSLATFSFTKGNTMIEGLVGQMTETLEHFKDKDIIDYVIASGAELIEQAEILAYTTALNMAELFEHKEAVQLLKQTLAEEKHALSLMSQARKAENDALLEVAK